MKDDLFSQTSNSPLGIRDLWIVNDMMAHARDLTQSTLIWGKKIASTRFQCSNCGVMVGRFDPACGHCGADLR